MNCEEYRKAVHGYARGHLSPGDVLAVEQHRQSCPHCVEFNEICKELSCTDFVTFLDDYVADSISPERRTVFERHMRVCPDCVIYLDSYRRTIVLGQKALRESDTNPAEAIPPKLIGAILAARRAGQAPGSEPSGSD